MRVTHSRETQNLFAALLEKRLIGNKLSNVVQKMLKDIIADCQGAEGLPIDFQGRFGLLSDAYKQLVGHQYDYYQARIQAIQPILQEAINTYQGWEERNRVMNPIDVAEKYQQYLSNMMTLNLFSSTSALSVDAAFIHRMNTYFFGQNTIFQNNEADFEKQFRDRVFEELLGNQDACKKDQLIRWQSKILEESLATRLEKNLKAKNRSIKQTFESIFDKHLDQLETYFIYGPHAQLFLNLKKQKDLLGKIKPLTLQRETSHLLTEFLANCDHCIKAMDKKLGYSWFYRITEILKKIIVGLIKGVGMLLSGLVGKGIASASERSLYKNTFFKLDQTDASKVLSNFKQELHYTFKEKQEVLKEGEQTDALILIP